MILFSRSKKIIGLEDLALKLKDKLSLDEKNLIINAIIIMI